MSRLDESVHRILTLKARYNLLTWQPVDPEGAAESCGTVRHKSRALQIAIDSITLLENDGLLPLSTQQSILLIVPDKVTDLDDVLRVRFPSLSVVVVALDPTPAQIAFATRRAATADVVVAATWDANQHTAQISLVSALASQPLVVTALNTPYDLAAFQEAGVTPGAYVCTYGDSTPSLEALAIMLSGEQPPRGRLPVTISDQYPAGYGWQQFEFP